MKMVRWIQELVEELLTRERCVRPKQLRFCERQTHAVAHALPKKNLDQKDTSPDIWSTPTFVPATNL